MHHRGLSEAVRGWIKTAQINKYSVYDDTRQAQSGGCWHGRVG
jgi:hypothetical protein